MPSNATQIPAVSPDEMLFAIQAGQAAAMHRMPSKNPEQFGINLIDEDGGGELNEIRLTDNPMNRFALTVREH